MGRPSLKTPELCDAICDRIANGESLRAICQDADMPHRDTVDNWLIADAAFSAKHARAREAQADLMDERILSAAEAVKPDNANAERVKIDAYKWRAERLNPKRYAAKTILAGDKDNPVETRNTTVLDVTKLSTEALREVVALVAPDNG